MLFVCIFKLINLGETFLLQVPCHLGRGSNYLLLCQYIWWSLIPARGSSKAPPPESNDCGYRYQSTRRRYEKGNSLDSIQIDMDSTLMATDFEKLRMIYWVVYRWKAHKSMLLLAPSLCGLEVFKAVDMFPRLIKGPERTTSLFRAGTCWE